MADERPTAPVGLAIAGLGRCIREEAIPSIAAGELGETSVLVSSSPEKVEGV